MYQRATSLPILRGALLLLLLWTAAPAFGQASRGISIGDLTYETNEVFSTDNILWPATRPWTDRDMLDVNGIIVGTRRTWTDPSGNTWPVQVAQVANRKFSDIQNVTVPVKGAFKRVFRNPFPTKMLDGKDWTRQFDAQDPVDPSIPSDAMIYGAVDAWPKFGMGIRIERWIYAFANDEHDDYVIQEWVISNTGTERREGVYIGLTAETSAHTYYPADIWGDYYGATYKDYVAGDASADSMRIWYSWDANRISERPTEDTKGKPHSQWGVFQEPQYFSYMVLHADKSATDESDDPAQPHKAGWSQRELSPDLNVANQEAVYKFLVDPWTANPGDNAYAEYDNAVTPKYRMLKDNLNLHTFDPTTEQEKTALFSFGPYTLEPGQDVRIVMAYAGGTIPLRLAIDAGQAYKNGAVSQLPLVALPSARNVVDMHGNEIVRNGDIYDPQGNLIARAGETLTQQQKDRIIDMGKDLVFQTASRALQAWKSGNVKKGQGTFNIPYAPAAPSLEGISENDQIRLKWTDNQVDSRGGPIVGYRIYRGYKRPPSITSPTDTTFLLLKELPAGTREYVDTEVVRGEQYYYYITAVNDRGVESSPLQNRTGTSATRSDEALNPTRAPDANWQENVVVVPNPFHVQAARKYGGKRLNFLNLPAYANIHIYTMTGDRVQTLEHDGATGDEGWQRQDTFSTMEIVSGVYLYVVEELDGPRGNPTGRQAIGKFVVIK